MNLEDKLVASNKYNLDEIEEILVETFTTIVYRISTKKACNGNQMDILKDKSA